MVQKYADPTPSKAKATILSTKSDVAGSKHQSKVRKLHCKAWCSEYLVAQGSSEVSADVDLVQRP